MITNDYDDYMCTKILQSFIYNKQLSDNEIKLARDIEFIDMLWYFIKHNRDLIDDNIVLNIYNKLDQLKYIIDENRIKRIEIINEIIICLNKECDKKINYDFYRNELAIRANHSKYYKMKDYMVDLNKKTINNSIVYDFYILSKHSSDITDSEFEKYLPHFQNDTYYLASIRAIMDEFPLMFLDDTFTNRVKTVIDNSNFDDKNKKLIKKIDKIRSNKF